MVQQLDTYEDWRRCITVDCGLKLTRDFIRARLSALRDPSLWETQRFVKIWGEPHRRRVVAWFEQAERDIRLA